MAYDELQLDRIGDRKTAVFFTISDTTPTYNFLVALAFSQMFNLLCERADNVHGGRLPHHVRVLWDEAANTGQVPQLEKLVAHTDVTPEIILLPANLLKVLLIVVVFPS